MLSLMCFKSSYACDICGCSMSNNNPFLFPYLASNYISLNYIHRSFETNKGMEGAATQYSTTMMLSGQYSPSKKLQITASLPYMQNQLNFSGSKTTTSGIGDFAVMANYKVWDKMTRIKRQTVTLSAGTKLPSGKYYDANKEALQNQNFQLGTGSIDYLLNAAYRLNFRKWIFSSSTTYKYNTQNKHDFRFGDVFTSGLSTVYKVELSKVAITPYVQFIYEKQMQDADAHTLQSHSGGYIFYNGAGCDVSSKQMTVGVNYQYAADQFLAGGEINVKPKLTAHISFKL